MPKPNLTVRYLDASNTEARPFQLTYSGTPLAA